MNALIQVAGVKDLAEAKLLAECGVEYLGFPLRLDIHKPDLSEIEARKIVDKIRQPQKAVLITYEKKSEKIFQFMDFLKVTHVQIHGSITVDELKKLREWAPDFFVIKSLIVRQKNEAE